MQYSAPLAFVPKTVLGAQPEPQLVIATQHIWDEEG